MASQNRYRENLDATFPGHCAVHDSKTITYTPEIQLSAKTHCAPLCPQNHWALHTPPSFLPSSQVGINTLLLPSELSISSSQPAVDPVADTGCNDWTAVHSDHSSEQALTIDAGGVVHTLTESKPQAAHSENLGRGAE